MNFGDIVGQSALTLNLQRQVGSGRIVHAYLFAGEPGMGKRTLAEICARALVAGFNHHFGAHGRGDADMIRREAARLYYRAEILPPVQDGGDVVSSTLIRALLENGDTGRARRLMEE